MTNPALVFTENDQIGRVAGVDTSRVAIDVTNSEMLTRLGIGQLIAIKGMTQAEFLIAMTDRVTRSLREELTDPIDGDLGTLMLSPADHMQAFVIGTYRTVDGEKTDTSKRGADSFPQIDRDCFIIEGSNLQRFMGILGAGLSDDERLKLGTFVADRSAEAIASGDKFFQRHAAILGSTGSGKSWAVALILERAAKLNFPNIIVFDMHGEYAPLADKSQGGFAQRLRIAGPGDLTDPKDDTLFLPYWLLNRDEMLSMILDRSDQNAPNQASRFTLHVRDLKRETLDSSGKVKVKETFTVDSPIPYAISDLVSRLKTDNTTKGVGKNGAAVKGDWEDKLTRFISRLEAKLDDRRYGFMFSPPATALDYGWLAKQIIKLLRADSGNGIKVIDFSEVPADVLPVVTGTLARLLYDVQFWMRTEARTPVTLLCDEAHLYLPVKDDADAVQRQALWSFERIAKEGRKYGFSLLVVSQRPSDVSRTILSQCNNFLSLRLTNDSDQNVIKRLMPDSLVGLTAMLPLLDTGEALLLGDAVLLPTRIKLDQPHVKPDSATRDFWREWGTLVPDEKSLEAAVECLRSQSRSYG
ncbi:TPA: ATP-binding protein [Enterobacter kobei]|uniref:ATP-binding protein n=1 Tax=Enterobacter cloacae complex TaxID=354276 RepID=UPI0003BEDE29|nr:MULTISPECIES: ATP-binding protein [Enterobacter cloacae complex]ELE9700887.1 ATP-binding protein [Enterobacter kobei]ELE9746900.1 ATP-binding protein [Enterobacter kobei]ELI8913657.1 ATP-binding protein [Enterobacter kobei]ELI8920733.1 ATP-binding protein [Enterobacter kobei]ELJ5832161.1 ATP-binding protein [Enterobacter kobei]